MMAAVVAAAVLGCGGEVEDEAGPEVWGVSPGFALLDVGRVDFEETRVGAVTSGVVRVMNAGEAPLLVTSAEVEGSGAFTVNPARWIGAQALEPGEGRIVAVSYAPRARGVDQGELVLRTDGALTPELRVPLRARTFQPSVEAPRDVTLEGARALESSETLFVIRNVGAADLNLDGPVVEEAQPGDLLLRYPDGPSGDPSEDAFFPADVLRPGEELWVRAIFAPERRGSYVFRLRWDTDDPTREELVVNLYAQASEPRPPEPGTCPVALALVSVVNGEGGRFETSLDVLESSVVELYGLTSYSPLSIDIERYEWEILERPEGSTVLLMPNPRSPTPRMFLDAAGRYLFGLNVFDAFGNRSCERAEVEVFSVPAP
jgi:hypothetical protein